MCNTYTQSVDAQGNTHFLVQLRQNLRWHDGVALNSSDVKFTLLNFRDVPAAVLQGNVELLQTVTILSATQLDIKMQGQSISHIVNLAGVPIIPRHLWELPGDKTYGDVGKANPAMTSTSYDMVVDGKFIGSGPYMCKSVFTSDLGRIGTGCSRNADGSRGGQSIAAGGSLFLQAFDQTTKPGNTDPFLQYMRSYNSAWGTGTGTAAESGQFQEFSYADQGKTGSVSLADLASVAACFGASGATPSCSQASYNYWHRSPFETTPGTISGEASIVASHYGDTYVSPFAWAQVSLENIVTYP